MQISRRNRRIFFLIMIVAWIVVGIFWSDEVIGLFKHEPKMAMMSRNLDEAPVKEALASSTTTTIMSLQNIVTGIVVLINLLGVAVYQWQKVFGKR